MAEDAALQFETVFLSKNPPEDERAPQLISWARRLHKLGLAPESAGNLSFRTKKGFVITGGGINLGAIEKEELVEVLRVAITKAQILVYVEGQMLPSRESLLHAEIYDLRTEINAVFHIHEQSILEAADGLRIPSTEREQPAGSYELAEEVAKLLGLQKDIKYFVLRNHGFISMGETFEEVGRLAEDMCKMAQRQKGANR